MIQPPQTDVEMELARITSVYHQRTSGGVPVERYGLFNDASLLHIQTVERHLLGMLKRRGLTTLADKRILDVGCGSGLQLRRFLDYGALPANLSGIDLLPQRIEQARALNRDIDWRVGSAHHLPYPDASFDVVMSFVVFSSILSAPLCQQIADEMWRVLKPGGLILCHDFIYGNPRNPAVRGVSPGEFRRLFQRPGARYAWRRVTLAPPISRMLAPRANWLADALERAKLFNTHMLAAVWQESP